MFRLWGKLWKDNRLLQDMVVCNGEKDLNRTGKVYRAIEEICYAFDLSRPMWLKSNITEFQKHDKVRFGKDNFVEEISFDYLEIHVIEEDEIWE